MKIAITGSRGLLGSALVPALSKAGHDVVRLVRGAPAGGEVAWSTAAGVDPARLAGVDAVVHLAGESIATRWTAARKRRIRDSRVQGTRALAESLAAARPRPGTLVCASAIGYYGSRGDERLTEDSPAGRGFLADVCREWEAAAEPAARAGVRVVHLRFGVILSPAGGALARMLPPFRLGLGGVVGSGRQTMSWIAIDDAAGAVQHALAHEPMRGPANAVSPSPVTNAEFTRALGRVLRRPAIFPLPAFAARLLFGEMADELLLSSARVEPARLAAAGYAFRHPDLEGALRHLLGRRS
jgi:hypothetical protein